MEENNSKSGNNKIKISVFTSPTCPHCHPTVEFMKNYAKENKGIIVEELSMATPNGRKQAIKYQIMSVPTIFIKGKHQDTFAFKGMPPKKSFEKAIRMARGEKNE